MICRSFFEVGSVGRVEWPLLRHAQLLVLLACLLRKLAPQIGHLEAVALLSQVSGVHVANVNSQQARAHPFSVLRGRQTLMPRRVVGQVRVGLGRCSRPGWDCSSGTGCKPTRIPHPHTGLQTKTGWYTDQPTCVCRRGFGWCVPPRF